MNRKKMVKRTKGFSVDIPASHKGKFTNYCKSNGFGGVTSACVRKGEHSTNPHTRKRAFFAGTVRGDFGAKGWNH